LDIPNLVTRYGIPLPALDYAGLPTGEVSDTFVEIQLWSDAPIRSFLAPDPPIPRSGELRE
jgi:hypothetical protein